MKVSLNIPYIMHFHDYHEIFDFVDRFNELVDGKSKLKLKYTEIQSDSDYGYVALFYFNKKDKVYKDFLKKYKDSLREDEDK